MPGQKKTARTFRLRAVLLSEMGSALPIAYHLFKRKSASAAAKRESMPLVGLPSLLTM
jgi:hypothetical protein